MRCSRLSSRERELVALCVAGLHERADVICKWHRGYKHRFQRIIAKLAKGARP